MKERIKILHSIRQGKIGGGESHVLDLVQQLDSTQFESHVLSFTDGEMVDRLAQLNVPCTVIHTERGFDRSVWPKVSKLAHELDVDLFHAHGTRACSNTYYSAKKLQKPLLYTIHGWSFHPDQRFPMRQLRTLSERYLVHQSNLNIAVSEANKALGIEKLGMPRSIVIKNGIDCRKFDPERKASLHRSDWKVPEDIPLIGMIARLTKQKDPKTFIRAAASLLKDGYRAHFVLVGGGELEDECRQLVAQLNIQANVYFAGFQTDVPGVLQLLDIYTLPSLWEGLPIGILEAMAMEKPVVATPVDGTVELVDSGKTGLLFPTGDWRKLADQWKVLLDQPDLCKAIGRVSREKVQEQFSHASMCAAVENAYRSLL